MTDVVVTLPKKFGLDKWLAEGDAPGEPDSGTRYYWKLGKHVPKIERGERVYVVHDGLLIGYAPLLAVSCDMAGNVYLVRGGGAVACTLGEHLPGFRGYRYVWWNREDELPYRGDPATATCSVKGCETTFDLGYEFPGLCGGEVVPDRGCGEPFCEEHLFGEAGGCELEFPLCDECCESYLTAPFEVY